MSPEGYRTYADAITKATALQLKMHLHIFDIRTRSVVTDFVLLKEDLFSTFKKVVRKSVLLWVQHKVNETEGESTEYNPRYFADFVFASESVVKELSQADHLTTHLEADVEVMRSLMAEVEALIDAELQPDSYENAGKSRSSIMDVYSKRLGVDTAAICNHIKVTLQKMVSSPESDHKEEHNHATKYVREIVRLFLDVIRLFKEITDCYFYTVAVAMDPPMAFKRKLGLHRMYWLSLQRTMDKAFATYSALCTPTGLSRANEVLLAWRRWAQLMVRHFVSGHSNVLSDHWPGDPQLPQAHAQKQPPAAATGQPQQPSQ